LHEEPAWAIVRNRSLMSPCYRMCCKTIFTSKTSNIDSGKDTGAQHQLNHAISRTGENR